MAFGPAFICVLGLNRAGSNLKARVWLSLALLPLQLQKGPWNFRSWGVEVGGRVTDALEGEPPPRSSCNDAPRGSGEGRRLGMHEAGVRSVRQGVCYPESRGREGGWSFREQAMPVLLTLA